MNAEVLAIVNVESGQDSTAARQADPDATRAGAPFSNPFHTGTVIAERYRLTRMLGSGSSANVWVAYDQRLLREVAIKTLNGFADEEDVASARLRREAQVLARIDHPRITGVIDLIELCDEDGATMPVLVTELLAGEDLGIRLKRGAMRLDEALTVCAEIADALRAAHRAGVVHRDLKPANIMLTSTGATLLDFGIARTEAESELTGASALGTPACMAPEQWVGEGVCPATDVYALGCLLYWCLRGEAPFAEHVLPALAMAHLELEPPPLPDRGQRPEIDELYRACVAKDPADRPTADQIAQRLAGATEWATATTSAMESAANVGPAAAPKTATTSTTTAILRRKLWTWRGRTAGGRVGARAAVLAATGSLLVAGAIAVPLTVTSADYATPQPTPRTTPSISAHAPTPSSASSSPSSAATSNAAPTPPSNAQAAPPKPGHTHTPPGHGKKK